MGWATTLSSDRCSKAARVVVSGGWQANNREFLIKFGPVSTEQIRWIISQ